MHGSPLLPLTIRQSMHNRPLGDVKALADQLAGSGYVELHQTGQGSQDHWSSINGTSTFTWTSEH